MLLANARPNTASANTTLYKNRLAELQRGIPTSYDQSAFIASLGASRSSRMRDVLFWILDGDDAPAKEENSV